MAVDYGDTRTGIAISDATRTLAGDALVINCKGLMETARHVADEASSRDVSCIVVGYPRNMDGSAGARAEISERFAEALKEMLAPVSNGGSAVDVILRDERLTTKGALRILSDAGHHGKKRKQTVDAVAASLILESYLRELVISSDKSNM